MNWFLFSTAAEILLIVSEENIFGQSEARNTTIINDKKNPKNYFQGRLPCLYTPYYLIFLGIEEIKIR